MMKRLAMLGVIGVLLVMTAAVSAQSATPVPTTTGPTNAVQARFFACSDSTIMTMNGVLLSGFSAYWQAFAGPGATGTALTNVRSRCMTSLVASRIGWVLR